MLVLSVLYVVTLAGIADGLSHQHKQRAAAGDLSTRPKIVKEKTKVVSPDFTLNDPDGRSVRLEDLKGKVVFLNFWATWCPPCIIEMPSLEKLHREFGPRGLVILAVNLRESAQKVRAFAQSHELTFKILLDLEGMVSRLYMAWALPVTVIVNKKGERVGMAIGYRNWDTPDARELVRRLLEEN